MQEECDSSALPRISGEDWRIALGMVKKCVIGEVCFDKDNIINCTKICLVDPSRGFWVIFLYYIEESLLAMPAEFPSHIVVANVLS